KLFIIFCRIGGFTFGGGYAMLPIIQKEIAEEKGWATKEEIIDFYAIGQSTPGIIAINTATMVGYKHKGIPGALAATAGMVFPSIIIITLIATFFNRFLEYKIVQRAFTGIQIAVIALITDIVFKMGKRAIKNYLGIIIFTTAFLILIVLQITPVIVIITSAAVGIIYQIKITNSNKNSKNKEN
ncbi:MAG: chromate transporter, partial [Halanaerobiales bacterium]